MAKARTFPTKNSLSEDTRQQMIDLANQTLADTLDLYTQTKQAHWNVKGMDFYQLHLLFDQLAENVFGYVDMLAERVTALGGTATGTVRMAAGSSRLSEYPLDAYDGKRHLELLIDRYANLANSVRAGIDAADRAGDKDTADLFTEFSRDLDKDLWFLEAHLQG